MHSISRSIRVLLFGLTLFGCVLWAYRFRYYLRVRVRIFVDRPISIWPLNFVVFRCTGAEQRWLGPCFGSNPGLLQFERNPPF